MRFINTGITPKLYNYIGRDGFRLYYGYESKNTLTLLGVADAFSVQENTHINDMKNQLSAKTKEAEDAKKEVERLNKILSGLIH